MPSKPTREERYAALERIFGEEIGTVIRVVADIRQNERTHAEHARVYWMFYALGEEDPLTDREIGFIIRKGKSTVQQMRAKFEHHLKYVFEQRRLR